MRKLSLKRKKTFTASLVKVRIFLEDIGGTMELGGIKCREIGILKNGSTGEYDIPNEKTNVFVVFSKTLPESFHFRYAVPEGSEDVELFTCPSLSPLRGNPFEIYSRNDLVSLGKADDW